MREIYFVACGILLGMTFRDWIERHEQRVAWRAADLAAENLEHRERTRRRNEELRNAPDVAPTEPAAATPA